MGDRNRPKGRGYVAFLRDTGTLDFDLITSAFWALHDVQVPLLRVFES